MNTITRTGTSLFAPAGAARPGVGLTMLVIVPLVAQVGGLFHHHVSLAVLGVVAWVCVGILLMTPLTLHVRQNPTRLRFLFLGCIPVRTVPDPAGLRVEKRPQGSALLADTRDGRSLVLVDFPDPFYAETLGREISTMLNLPMVTSGPGDVQPASSASTTPSGLPFYLQPPAEDHPSLESFAGRGRLRLRRRNEGCELSCRRGINLWSSTRGGYVGCGLVGVVAFGALAVLNVYLWVSGPPALRLGFIQDPWFYGLTTSCVLLGLLMVRVMKPLPPLVITVTARSVAIGCGQGEGLCLPVDDIAQSAFVAGSTEEESYLGIQAASGRLFSISDLDNETLVALEGAIKAAIREMRSDSSQAGSQRPPAFVRLMARND